MSFWDRFKTQSETHVFSEASGTWSGRWKPEYEYANKVEVVDRTRDGVSLAIDYQHFVGGPVAMEDVYLPSGMRQATDQEIVRYYVDQGYIGSWAQNMAMQYEARGQTFPFK